MLRAFIRKLQQKPKEAKERYAKGVAGTVTGLVLLGWLVLSSPADVDFSGIMAEGQEAGTVFSTLFDEFSEQTADLFADTEPITPNEEVSDMLSSTSTLEEMIAALAAEGASSTAATASTSPREVRIATTSSTTETE